MAEQGTPADPGVEAARDEHAASAPRITELDAWLRRRGLSPFEGARRLGISYSVMRRTLQGETPNLGTAAKFVYGSNGQISFEALLPPDRRAALRRRFRGLLLDGRTPPRRKTTRRQAVG